MPISQAPRFNVEMFRTEHRHCRYEVEVEVNLSFDEVLKPSFWAHVGSILRARDVIEVWPKDNSWMAELRVIESGPMFAKVALWSKKTMETKADDALEVEALANGKFRVRRGPDIMKEGFASKKDAQRWIDDYGSGTAKAA
jgi:hypothetical protein